MLTESVKSRLRSLAARYETAAFLREDPSWFMHQVSGAGNQEVMGFLASVLSYGSRRQFFPKIQRLLDSSNGEPWQWVRSGSYAAAIPDDGTCFYRLYSNRMMRSLLDALRGLLLDNGTIGQFVAANSPNHKSEEALMALSGYFRERGIRGMVPSPVSSVAKRPCMYLRWMVRSSSPVDLGLWASAIDRSTLYIPLDTHVMQEATALGLISGKSASWRTVVRLTQAMSEVFPGDPARGDFALFGYGVNKSEGYEH